MLDSVCTKPWRGGIDVAVTRRRNQRSRIQRKNYRIDVAKLQRTQRILGTRTETETIHKALDLVAEEAGLVVTLRDFVLKGGGHIEDIDARR
jgi:Arc/MetJ family transcription regulator